MPLNWALHGDLQLTSTAGESEAVTPHRRSMAPWAQVEVLAPRNRVASRLRAGKFTADYYSCMCRRLASLILMTRRAAKVISRFEQHMRRRNRRARYSRGHRPKMATILHCFVEMIGKQIADTIWCFRRAFPNGAQEPMSRRQHEGALMTGFKPRWETRRASRPIAFDRPWSIITAL